VRLFGVTEGWWTTDVYLDFQATAICNAEAYRYIRSLIVTH
jgi:hypothetical protein